MQKNKLLILVGLIFLLGISACQKEEAPKIIPIIEDAFTIDMWENIEESPRIFVLVAETIEPTDCENTTFVYRVNRSGKNITVSINEIRSPTECIPSTEPARTYIPIGHLPEQDYNIEINLQNVIINSGILNVRENSYKLRLLSTDGFELIRQDLQRIPAYTLWGYFSYDRQLIAENTLSSFLQELESVGAESQTFTNGYYGYFSINSGKNISIFQENPSYVATEDFIYKYTGDLETLQSLVEDFRQQYPEGLEIRLFTSKGEKI